MLESLKALASIVAYYFGFWTLVFWLCALVEKRPILAVFTFHRIVDNVQDPRFLQGYERGLPLAQYTQQIKIISRYFRIVGLAEFREIATGEKTPRGWKPITLLTFDDADSDHVRTAFPLLQSRGLPGVSFVPTGFIDTSKHFYHCRLTNICNKLTPNDFKAILRSPLPEDVRSVLLQYASAFDAHRQQIRRELISPFARMTPSQRDDLIAAWERFFSGSYELGIHCMRWDDVLSLPRINIAVGSHTVNHERLALLDEDAVLRELSDSKAILESRFGHAIDAISYPEGSYTYDVVRQVQRAGYRLGFTTDDDLVQYPAIDLELLMIPRISLDSGSSHRVCFSFGSKALKRFARFLGPTKR